MHVVFDVLQISYMYMYLPRALVSFPTSLKNQSFLFPNRRPSPRLNKSTEVGDCENVAEGFGFEFPELRSLMKEES